MSQHRIGATKNKWKHSVYRNRERKRTQKYNKKRDSKYEKKNKSVTEQASPKSYLQSMLYIGSKSKLNQPLLNTKNVYEEINVLLPFNKNNHSRLLFLVTIDGKRKQNTLSIKIHAYSTINGLLKNICDELHCKKEHFNLYRVKFNQKSSQYISENLMYFDGTNKLIDYGINCSTLLHFKWKSLILSIKTKTESIKLTNIDYNDTETNIISQYTDTKTWQHCYWSPPFDFKITMNGKSLSSSSSDYWPPKLYETDIKRVAVLDLLCYLTLNIPNKGTIKIEIDHRLWTINDLKRAICDYKEYNIDINEFEICEPSYLFLSSYSRSSRHHKYEVIDESISIFKPWKMSFKWNSVSINIVAGNKNEFTTLMVEYGETVKNIKTEYSKQMNIDHTSYRLYYGDKCLQDDDILQDYKIVKNGTLRVIHEIAVTIPDMSKMTVNIAPFAIIRDLRIKICEVLTLSMDEFRLLCVAGCVCCDKYLCDDGLLCDYGIKQGSKHKLNVIYLLKAQKDECDTKLMNNIWLRQIPKWKQDRIDLRIKKLDGKEICLRNVRLNYDTIRNIKVLIQFEIKIYYKLQTLIYDGFELDDKMTLKQLRINNGKNLYLLINESHHRYVNDLLVENIISFIDELDYNQHVEIKNITKLFNDTSKINDVYVKIDNIYKIHRNFERNKQVFEGLLSLKQSNDIKRERFLFHGTSLNKVRKIIDNGFNRDFNRRHVYGKGVYFTNISHLAASYSHQKSNELYEEKYVILVCRTYIGQSRIGKYSMKEYDLYKDDKCTQYDSFVDNLLNPTIFVINRDYHAIPYYLIVWSLHNIK